MSCNIFLAALAHWNGLQVFLFRIPFLGVSEAKTLRLGAGIKELFLVTCQSDAGWCWSGDSAAGLGRHLVTEKWDWFAGKLLFQIKGPLTNIVDSQNNEKSTCHPTLRLGNHDLSCPCSSFFYTCCSMLHEMRTCPSIKSWWPCRFGPIVMLAGRFPYGLTEGPKAASWDCSSRNCNLCQAEWRQWPFDRPAWETLNLPIRNAQIAEAVPVGRQGDR